MARAAPSLPGMRDAIGGRIRALVGSGSVDLSRPPGDAGLFGPQSVAWRVHADFSAMMIGGVSALLLQMLHWLQTIQSHLILVSLNL